MEHEQKLPSIKREDVLRIVKARGPIIPNQIKKVLKVGDTILLGAILSELASKGLVKISHTKIGGSPFYYDPGKPATLERANEYLNEKDVRTYKLLKEQRILRDDEQDALTRVSLRNIKDFSREITVNAPEGPLTFWKYYIVKDEEAEILIRKKLGLDKPVPTPPPVSETPTQDEKEPVAEPSPQKEKPEKKQAAVETKQHSLIDNLDDTFYKQVCEFFEKNNITILEQKIIRKKSEIDFTITLPTPVGTVEYYCKAKNKKKSTDGDLASAKLQGMSSGLPTVYLTTGEITKKAKIMLAKEFKGLVVKEL